MLTPAVGILLLTLAQASPFASTPSTRPNPSVRVAGQGMQAFPLKASTTLLAASAVQGRNSIFGFVWDSSRRPVYNANVELLDEVDGLVARTRTDNSGRYFFNNLRTGTYQIKVQPLGTDFETQIRRVNLVTFTANAGAQSLQEDFTLRLSRRAAALNANTGAPGTVFVQEVPEPAKKSYEQGIKFLEEKKTEAGIGELKKAVDIFPTYYNALERLGVEHVQGKRYEPALGYLSKAVEVNPRGYMSLYSLGIARYNLKQLKEAAEALRQAVAIAPADVNSNMWLGIVLFKDGQLGPAETHLKKAYALSGKRIPDTHMYLAQIYSNTKRYREAADELELYLKEAPDLRDTEKIKQLIKTLRDKAK